MKSTGLIRASLVDLSLIIGLFALSAVPLFAQEKEPICYMDTGVGCEWVDALAVDEFALILFMDGKREVMVVHPNLDACREAASELRARTAAVADLGADFACAPASRLR